MRAYSNCVALAACLALAGVASGCGASGSPTAPKQVGLVLTAPTNGATVGVRKIEIAGNVMPLDAAVTVAGQVVPVRNGSFALPMALAGATETITVTARAPGYNSATSRTTVSYSTQTASEIAAASVAATTRTVTKPLRSPSFVLAPVAPKPPAKAAPTSTANSSPSTVLALPGNGPTHAPTPAPGSAPGSRTTPGSSSPGATGSAPAATPAPPAPGPAPLVWTAAQIHRIYVDSCVRGNGGHPVISFCECTYKQIARSGGLRSRASLFGLVRSLRPYEQTHDLSLLPAAVRRALVACVQFLPDNNVAAKPVITRLPSLSHPALPAP